MFAHAFEYITYYGLDNSKYNWQVIVKSIMALKQCHIAHVRMEDKVEG